MKQKGIFPNGLRSILGVGRKRDRCQKQAGDGRADVGVVGL